CASPTAPTRCIGSRSPGWNSAVRPMSARARERPTDLARDPRDHLNDPALCQSGAVRAVGLHEPVGDLRSRDENRIVAGEQHVDDLLEIADTVWHADQMRMQRDG